MIYIKLVAEVSTKISFYMHVFVKNLQKNDIILKPFFRDVYSY